MESDMRGIGQLARDSGLTVSALRFYDSAGVLVPAWVDPQTGYRWYDSEQLWYARVVARLRRVGMPLAGICQVLERRTDTAVVSQLLDAHLQRLEDGLTDARRELSSVRALLDLKENDMTLTRTATHVTVGGTELRQALAAVRFAVSDDPEQPMLRGVLLDVDDTDLRAVATDRYRLAVCMAAVNEVTGPAVSAVVPADLIDEAARLIDEHRDDVTVVINKERIVVRVGDSEIDGPRVDYDFPNYRRLTRVEGKHSTVVDVGALRAAVVAGAAWRSAPGHEGNDDVIVLGLDADGSLTVGGDGMADHLRVGVSREFLLDALAAGVGDQRVLELDGPITPLAVRTPDREDMFSILMPIVLQ